MSLVCIETKQDIEYGEPLFAGTQNPARMFVALSQPVIDRIPAACRSASTINGGINIHRASAGRNFTGSYAWSSFRIGEHLFSLSMADARRYLPQLIKELGC
jgi:hypothetical protein